MARRSAHQGKVQLLEALVRLPCRGSICKATGLAHLSILASYIPCILAFPRDTAFSWYTLTMRCDSACWLGCMLMSRSVSVCCTKVHLYTGGDACIHAVRSSPTCGFNFTIYRLGTNPNLNLTMQFKLCNMYIHSHMHMWHLGCNHFCDLHAHTTTYIVTNTLERWSLWRETTSR